MRVFFTAATGSVQMSESVCRQRNPQNTTFYTCVEDHFEAFEQVRDIVYEPSANRMDYADCGQDCYV